MSAAITTDTVRLRLTRRGRIVLGALSTVIVAAALALVAAIAAPQAQASIESAQAQEFHYVIPQPGSSLWTVATELDPAMDPRDLVAEIVRLNQLDGSGVQAGQPVAVPLRYSGSEAVISAEELGLRP
ncbi:MAG: LysM peptidoglycan-binding domain-containing protein [Leucobacter sp.]